MAAPNADRALVNAERAQADAAAGATLPNTREAIEKGTQVRARRGSRRTKAKETAQKRQRAKTFSVPPYRAEWKRAAKNLIIETPKISDLQICRDLDESVIKLPKKWTRGENRSFEEAYRDTNLRQRIHTAISKIRADLRKTRVID